MNFKKWIVTAGILALPLGVANHSEAAVEKGSSDNVHVQVNGNYIKMDVAAFVKDDRTLVPLRAVTEAFGADVQWDEENDIATVTLNEISVKLKLGSTQATLINNATNYSLTTNLDVPAQSVNYRTMVPLRFVSESFSSEVAWDGENYTAIIKRDSSTIPTNAQKDQFMNDSIAYAKEYAAAESATIQVATDMLNQQISFDTYNSRFSAEVAKMQTAVTKIENLKVPNHALLRIYYKDTLAILKEGLAYRLKLQGLFRPDGTLDEKLVAQLAAEGKALDQHVVDYKNKFTNYIK